LTVKKVTRVRNMATIPPVPPVPKFELHGIELNGSFTVYFSGQWYMQNLKYIPTKISGEDLKKLAEASKSGIEVPIRFGNGEGRAKISSFFYDPNTGMLTNILFKLTDWTPQ